MRRLAVLLKDEEALRLNALAKRESREETQQLAFMVALVLDIFESLPEYMDKGEQSDVLLRLLRDAVRSEHGQELIAIRLRVSDLEIKLDEIREAIETAMQRPNQQFTELAQLVEAST